MPDGGSGGDDPGAVARAFEEAPGPWWVFEGPEHRVVAVNAAARALSSRPGVLGRTAEEVWPGLRGRHLSGLLDDVYRTGSPSSADAWGPQGDVDGDGEPEEPFPGWTLTRWHDASGAARGVVLHGDDVTGEAPARRRALGAAAEAGRLYRRALDVVAELQEALLPRSLPVLPCADLAAHYRVAAAEHAAGGDWYDALVRSSGGLALVVGDVVGSGVAAAAVMSQLRAVLAERLHAGAGLGQALADLEAAAGRIPGAVGTTVCVAVLDPPTGDVEYSTRGHPPPLVTGPDGSRHLAATGGGPLGSGVAGGTGTARLRTGEVLVLFSDGLVERPGRPYEEGLAALARVAADATADRALPRGTPPSAARVCAHSVELLGRRGGDDDVTVLAAQLRDPVAPLRLDLPALAESLSVARRRVRGWLAGLGVVEEDVLALELGVSEALANSVAHAYRGSPAGRVRATLELCPDGTAAVRVEDDGTWAPPGAVPGDSGRGLSMISAVGSGLVLERAGAGTCVSFRRTVRRPVGSGSRGGRPGAEPAGDALRLELLAATPPVLRVRGAVDAGGADLLEAEVLRVARGGAAEAVVDLGGVTHLASAGVRALLEVLRRTSGTGRAPRLVAPDGSAAAFVLDLAALPRDPSG
ncbi:sigma-F factor regulator [Kineococcus sp. NUM-3379]